MRTFNSFVVATIVLVGSAAAATIAIGQERLAMSEFPSFLKKPDPESTPAVVNIAVGRSELIGVPEGGVELGFGWDSRYGRVIPSRCIDYAPVSLTGQTTTLDLHEVSDKSEIMEKLNVSASISVKTMFASGSAKASFAKDSKVSSSSNTLLMHAVVNNGTLFAGPRMPQEPARGAYPSTSSNDDKDAGNRNIYSSVDSGYSRRNHAVILKPWAEKLLVSNSRKFRRNCGDSFIAAINTGATLVATFTFKTSSSETVKKAKAAIKAQYGPVSVSGDISKENTSALESSNMQVNVMQVGGSSGPIPTTPEALVDKLKLLPLEAARAPKFLTMEIRSYDSLANWPSSIPLISDADDAEVVADYYWFLASFYEAIEEVLQNPEQYSFRTGLIPTELADLQDEVVNLRAGIRSTMATITGLQQPEPITQTSFDLDFRGKVTLTIPQPTKALTANIGEQLSGADQHYDSFADKLRSAVLFGNPNTLRLNLPLPRQIGLAVPNSSIRLKEASVDHYLRPQAKRMCAIEPTDSECLTNQELRMLAAEVPVSLPATPRGTAIQNVRDGTCVVARREKPGKRSAVYISGPCSTAHSDNRGAFERRDKKPKKFGRRGAASCILRLGKTIADGFCGPSHQEGLGLWTFVVSTGEIRNGKDCIESGGPNARIRVVPCSSLAKKPTVNLWQSWRMHTPEMR